MSIGILAYGSLIGEPGDELEQLIINRIPCITPFNVEFGRISSSRSNAPTLIPVEDRGAKVSAVILVLKDNVSLEHAKSMLWRRETRTTNLNIGYKESKSPGPNRVLVKMILDFHEINNVLYTSIGANLDNVTPYILATHAIDSIMEKAGDEKKDGIRYLLDAKNNGITTALSNEYEASILSQTKTASLEEAISKMDRLRHKHIEQTKDFKEFEVQVIELADLICEYGLKTTIEKTGFKGNNLEQLVEEHRLTFMQYCHDGFKLAQSRILKMMLEFENHRETLTDKLKNANREKQKETASRLKEKIAQIEYKEDILRHLIDCISWQLFNGQLYINRRLYQGVKGSKKLKSSNINSAILVAEQINKHPYDFALITDLSAFIQTADLIHVKETGEKIFVELKQGGKSREILKVMDKMLASEQPPGEILKEANLDINSMDQLIRNLKQFAQASNVTSILRNDKGKDKSGRDVNIITPKEDTPMFLEELNTLEKQLSTQNWAYNVVDECLHIAFYKGIMKNGGPAILEGLAESNNQSHFIVNFLTVIKSLNKPFFFLPVSKSLIFDILFGRVKFFIMLEMEKFMDLFPKFGLKAEWMTPKETMKIKQSQKNAQMFTLKNKGIKITKDGVEGNMIVTHGLLSKMFFEHIYPSYIAYSCHYYFEPKKVDEQTDNKA
jgi:hypothetical protein